MKTKTQINIRRSQERLAESIIHADSFGQRLIGLLGTRTLAQGHGLWIVPCRGIHTFGMRYAIDVIFLDMNCTVLKVAHDVKPNRLVMGEVNTSSVIELASNTLNQTDLVVGDQLVTHHAVQTQETGKMLLEI